MKKKLSYEKMAKLLSEKFESTVIKDLWYGGAVCLNCGWWTKEMREFLKGYETTSGNDFLLIGFFET